MTYEILYIVHFYLSRKSTQNRKIIPAKVVFMEISEAVLVQAMRWHEQNARAQGDVVWGVLPAAVAVLVDPLYEVWGTGKSVEPSSLSKKAIESLNGYWTGVGSPLRITGAT
jgi:hypothetical protein